MKSNDILKLVTSLVVCQLAGVIGSLATFPFVDTWYTALNKPFFTPPNFVFGPVWITLYFLMGVALFLIWQKGLKTPQVNVALMLFFIQLALNTLWSFAFFGCKDLLTSVIIIVLLWIAILFTLIDFYKLSEKAGWLLVPYLVWVTIAAALNIAIYLLN
jgi:tryptophan-rich sensory protein